MISPVLRIFLNLWQIFLHEVNRWFVKLLDLLKSWWFLLLNCVKSKFKNLKQRIFLNVKWLVESSFVLSGGINVHSSSRELHGWPWWPHSSDPIIGCSHHCHCSIFNRSSDWTPTKHVRTEFGGERWRERRSQNWVFWSWSESGRLRNTIRLFHFHRHWNWI